jgi:hypothetical protein
MHKDGPAISDWGEMREWQQQARQRPEPKGKPALTERKVRARAKACDLRFRCREYRPHYRLIDDDPERCADQGHWWGPMCLWRGNSLTGAMAFLDRWEREGAF